MDYLHIPVLFSREASNVAARNAHPNFLKIGELKKFVILRLLLIMEHPAADGFQKKQRNTILECSGCKLVTMVMKI